MKAVTVRLAVGLIGLNAVTQWVDHRLGQRQTADEAMWRKPYGSGFVTKRRALDAALDLLGPSEPGRYQREPLLRRSAR